jgi:NarL family two-component system sensor histidine kinase LiaS
MFALLISPDHTVLASSYPARYPTQSPVATALPQRAASIAAGLRGRSGSGAYAAANTTVVYAVEPVWNAQRQPIGAVYVEMPSPAISADARDLWNPARAIVANTGGVLLVMMIPIGALFGWLTTAGPVRRIDALAAATRRFAAGDYARLIPVGGADEIGQLEEHFNHMARQLDESGAQRQALAGQNARLAERSRIARDLHDSVKQQVFAISMHLGTALAVLEGDPAAGLEQVRAADTLAYQTQQELTILIQALRPAALQAREFSAALQAYVAEWSRRYAIAAELELPTDTPLPAAVEDGMLRVTQEALANVARHSQARQARVTLDIIAAQATLTVADDGRGFTPETVDGAGVGLHSMRERMLALGGALTVTSAPGAGTLLVATCPLPE